MAGEQAPRHEEHAHPGSSVVYSLTPKGLLKEEFTSGVKTHTDLIYYDEIWDTFRARRLHRRGTVLLAWTTVLSAVVPCLPGVSWVMLLPVWGTLTAGWVLLALALQTVVVTLYDFDGQDMATLHGPSNSAFIEFLGELDVRVRNARYPLQGTLEGLDLGSCSWKGFHRRWSCRYLYDRVVFESEGPFGFEVREFYGLTALNPPVRLAWKVPKIALAGFLFGVLFAGPLSYIASAGGGHALDLAFGGLAVLAAACAIWLLLFLRVAVSVSTGTGTVESVALPWWQTSQRRSILTWFARIVRLADRTALIDYDDYWEFHRAKLEILRKESFLDTWPYRSALSRLNSQEREDLGGE
jgi:hypothetical protein